jgi:hypothetical protein
MTGTGIIGAAAGLVPQRAVAFGALGAAAIPVDPAHPLPTAQTVTAATSAPLAGSSAASGMFGPFTPQLGRPIWISLSGTWTGTVTVQRSTDGGATKLSLTAGGQPWAIFTANANEAIGEESVDGASWWISAAIGSGTLAYRVQQ